VGDIQDDVDLDIHKTLAARPTLHLLFVFNLLPATWRPRGEDQIDQFSVLQINRFEFSDDCRGNISRGRRLSGEGEKIIFQERQSSESELTVQLVILLGGYGEGWDQCGQRSVASEGDILRGRETVRRVESEEETIHASLHEDSLER
jgi:hypothetical protein